MCLHEAGCGGKHAVGRDGRYQDHVDIARGDAALVQRLLRGLRRHVGGRFGGVAQDAALHDARPRADPLVVGVHQLFQVGVGEPVVREVTADRGDGGCAARVLGHRKAVTR